MIIYDSKAEMRDKYGLPTNAVALKSRAEFFFHVFKGCPKTKHKVLDFIKFAEEIGETVYLVNNLSEILNGTVSVNKNLKYNFYTMEDIKEEDYQKLIKSGLGIIFEPLNIYKKRVGLRNPYHLYNY